MTILEFDISTYGSAIRERRLDLQLTQKQLASLADVSTATIEDYENGHMRPSVEKLLKVCKALKIDEVRIDTARVLRPWEKR